MILKETILSAFNNRGTLLKWLKKVEKLLRESTLLEIKVEKINDTEAVIKLFFEDNTAIQSDPFNIDILISSLSLFTEDVVLTAGSAGITITGNSKVNQSNVRAVMRIPIIGSDTVVIDVTEDGEHFEVHLDAVIAQKIQRALVTPVSRPQSTELVAVDNTGAQVMLKVGEGLTIENGVLKIQKANGVLGLRRFNNELTAFDNNTYTFAEAETFIQNNYINIEPIPFSPNINIVGLAPAIHIIDGTFFDGLCLCPVLDSQGVLVYSVEPIYLNGTSTDNSTYEHLWLDGEPMTVTITKIPNADVEQWLLANTESVEV